MTLNFKDLRVGALFVAIGLFFGLYAYGKIATGTPARMGPGFFPVVLSILLVALGLAICVQALRASPSAMALVPWRALVLVLAAPVFFGLMIDRLGFAPTVAATALIAAFASRETGWRRALLISAGLTGLSVAIFIYGLGIPLRLFGPWLVG